LAAIHLHRGLHSAWQVRVFRRKTTVGTRQFNRVIASRQIGKGESLSTGLRRILVRELDSGQQPKDLEDWRPPPAAAGPQRDERVVYNVRMTRKTPSKLFRRLPSMRDYACFRSQRRGST